MSSNLFRQTGSRQRKTWNCHQCGSVAFPNFRGGTSSPQACRGTKCVRTNSGILHTGTLL